MGKKAPPVVENLSPDVPHLQYLSYVVAGLVLVLTVAVMLGRKPTKPFLSRTEKDRKKKVKLVKREQISHDTLKLQFGLPTRGTVLGLPIGNHFKLYCPNPKGSVMGQWNGRDDMEKEEEEIERKYTPTSSDDEVGYVELVIKVYKGGVLEQFPDGGKMSQYIDSLNVGQEIEISGPWGAIEYKGNGLFMNYNKEIRVKQLGMIAGGTGITPMLQIVNAIMKSSDDATKVSLIFANKTEDDILVRDMLEALAAKHSDRFNLWYTLDQPPEGWKYSSGFINEQMIKDHLPPASADTICLLCGPPPMIKFACKPNLEKAGYDLKTNVLSF